MGKGLFASFLVVFVFVGLCSRLEAKPCPEKSFLEKGLEELAIMDEIGEIDDPDLRAAAIKQFLDEVKPALEQAIEKGYNKFAWNIGGDNWWIIYEHKRLPVAKALLVKIKSPPSDATIIETIRR